MWPGASTSSTSDSAVSISGRLDRVDLREARFRVHDDVGNDIVLDRVRDPGEAAVLVGSLVTATGTGVFDARGKLTRIRDAVVEATALPAWMTSSPELDPLADAQSPPLGRVAGVTPEEMDEFLALVKE